MADSLANLVDLTGRVALVTGASRGLGAATVKLLAASNCRVALMARSREDLERVAADIPAEQVRIFVSDMKDDEAIAAAIETIQTEWGGVDILLNNAGIVKAGFFADITVEEWQEMIDVNLTAPFKLVKAVAPHMQEQGWGRIVNITSITAQTGGVKAGVHYAASKGGLGAVTKTLARDLAPFGVTVNNIAPGQIDTNPDFLTDEQRVQMNEMIPLGRLGVADDIAKTVLFLVSSMGDYITGATIDVNGGLLKR